MDTAFAAMVDLAAAWTPDALGALLDQALEVAALTGRDEVFGEIDGERSFAEPDFTRRPFAEQIAFLTQKRPTVSRTWTDFMRGQHDRALVVAGVTDLAMIEEFATAIIEGAKTYDIRAFGAEFDRLVAKYGWEYNGGRNWRVRTIFETNIRTSYMAGRLKQMRDPDVVRLRPYWQYRHAATRMPLHPREQHLAWDGLVLDWDDPWWEVYYPPNDWKCSCGVRTLSRGELRRLGKAGPDTAPEILRRPYTHRATGTTVMQPEGTGYGWDYMPGRHWEQGLVPSLLLDDPAAVPTPGRHLMTRDAAEPIQALIDRARPFVARILPEDLDDTAYLNAFLTPFGAAPGEARLHVDQAGGSLVISDQLFLDRDGALKLRKGGRHLQAAMLAETILDPDEIWIGPRLVEFGAGGGQEVRMSRRFIRVDPTYGLFVGFDLGGRNWEAITGFRPTRDFDGRPETQRTNWAYLTRQRVGRLLWSRK